ncbi:Remorin family protein [Abeliophyllum distichum]|uniref:Remorin family protein n=1 Tax=Abeliophyllum distichum TaxID=126358 RepID=A0ABD1QFH4_9LAMI
MYLISISSIHMQGPISRSKQAITWTEIKIKKISIFLQSLQNRFQRALASSQHSLSKIVDVCVRKYHMEYERVHKVQTGIISPSKLRMKLMGPHHQRKKDGSKSDSSRTSPSRLEDSEFVKNRLLATGSGDFVEGASGLEVPPIKYSSSVLAASQGDGNLSLPKGLLLKENEDVGSVKMQLVSMGDGSNFSSVQHMRTYEDDILDYDSTSSFEFHKGERSLHHPANRSFSRPLPSKWNDAEKWIMNRQNTQSNNSKKTNIHNQVNRVTATNMVRVSPESTGSENKSSVKQVDFCQPASQTGAWKSAFASQGAQPISGQGNGANALIDLCPESKDLMEVESMDSSCPKTMTEDTTGVPAPRSVSMRDMGTEMTPIPSQEPSRSATPVGATTPFRSPTSSIPSTPRRGEPAPSPIEHSIDNALQLSTKKGKTELSDQEQKLKTRREIVALGVQLGKMNIAAWATAWEEAEKSKHASRFKREEIKIQAWESQQKAKLEAEMRKIEVQIEQMRAQAQAKMTKKIAMARQKSEKMRAAAEARKNCQAKKTAASAEYIRQTGRTPSFPFTCCGWL